MTSRLHLCHLFYPNVISNPTPTENAYPMLEKKGDD